MRGVGEHESALIIGHVEAEESGHGGRTPDLGARRIEALKDAIAVDKHVASKIGADIPRERCEAFGKGQGTTRSVVIDKS